MLTALVVIVMMVMTVLTALIVVMMVVVTVLTALVVVMMVVVTVLTALVVIVMVVMLVLTALVVIVMVVMLVVVMVVVMMSANRAKLLALHKVRELLLDRIASLHSTDKLLCIKLRDRSCYKHSGLVVSLNKRERLLELCLCCIIGMAENNTAGIFNLIAEELTKVLHIHLTLVHVNNNGKAIERHILKLRIFHRLDNVAELSNARGLDYHAIGRILVYDLPKRLAEISNE